MISCVGLHGHCIDRFGRVMGADGEEQVCLEKAPIFSIFEMFYTGKHDRLIEHSSDTA